MGRVRWAGLLLLASWRTRFLRDGSGERLPIWGEVLLYASMPVFHLHTFLALSFVLACWFIGSKMRRVCEVVLALNAIALGMVVIPIVALFTAADPPHDSSAAITILARAGVPLLVESAALAVVYRWRIRARVGQPTSRILPPRH